MFPAEFWILPQSMYDLLVEFSIYWWFAPCISEQLYWSLWLPTRCCCNYSSPACSYLFLWSYFCSFRIGSWISGIILYLTVICWAFIILDVNIQFGCCFGFGSFRNSGSARLGLTVMFWDGSEISLTTSLDFGCLFTVWIPFWKSSRCVSYVITRIDLLSSLSLV